MTSLRINPSLLEESIEVQPHNPEWRMWFKEECPKLVSIFGKSAQFQHVGSSCVPNLYSKPIVDILVGLKSFEVKESAASALKDIGYEYLGRLHENQARLFARKRGERSFNLQIVPLGSPEWDEKIAFRDYLLSHPDAVLEYSRVKEAAIAEGHRMLLAYHKRKDEVTASLLRRALEWRALTSNK